MAWMGGLSSFAEPPAETLQEQMEVQVFASPVCVFVCNVRERVQMFFLATTLMEDLVTFSCKSWPWRFVVRRKTCNNGEKGCCVLMLKEKYSRRKTCPHAVCVCVKCPQSVVGRSDPNWQRRCHISLWVLRLFVQRGSPDKITATTCRQELWQDPVASNIWRLRLWDPDTKWTACICQTLGRDVDMFCLLFSLWVTRRLL